MVRDTSVGFVHLLSSPPSSPCLRGLCPIAFCVPSPEWKQSSDRDIVARKPMHISRRLVIAAAGR